MRNNKQSQQQLEKAAQTQNKVHSSKASVHVAAIIGILAFLPIAIMGSVSLVQVKKIYAMSECGVLFLCPTPTPHPTLPPTPAPHPKPSPAPIMPTPSPSPLPTPHPKLLTVSSPTVTTRVSPTATAVNTSIKAAQAPVPSPTNIPTIKAENVRRQASGQLENGSEFASLMVIAAGIFLCLLFSLGIGLFILRRVLLPPIDVKVPPSGATPWSRNPVPNPDSLRNL